MGFDFLKLNSSTFVPVDVQVCGLPRHQGLAPFTTVDRSQWFREQHFQELLALLKTCLPPVVDFQKCPSGDVTGDDFVFSWKLHPLPLGKFMILKKAVSAQSVADSSESSTVRPRCRLVQSCLPWRQCAELPAAAPASTVTEIGVVRYESVRSLPFVLRVVVNQRPTEVQAEPESIPITAFFSPIHPQDVTNTAVATTPDPVKTDDSYRLPQVALSPRSGLPNVPLNTEQADLLANSDDMPGGKRGSASRGARTEASLEDLGLSVLHRNGPQQTQNRSKKGGKASSASAKSCGSVSNQELKNYRQKMNINQLSMSDGQAALRQTCALLSKQKSSPTPISSPVSSQEAGSPVVTSLLSTPSPTLKKVDWDKLYHPTVGEIEMVDDRQEHANLMATTSQLRKKCWICSLEFVSSPDADFPNHCSECLRKCHPEWRCNMSKLTPTSSKRSTPLLQRRHTVATAEAAGSPSPLAGVLTPCRSPRKFPPRMKRSLSLCDATFSEDPGLSPPPKVARVDCPCPVAEAPLDLDKQDEEVMMSPPRSGRCYGNRRRKRTTEKPLATSGGGERVPSWTFLARGYGDESPAGSLSQDTSQAISGSFVTDLENNPNGIESTAAVCTEEAPLLATSSLARRIAKARSQRSSPGSDESSILRNAKLGRIMEMDPPTSLDDTLFASARRSTWPSSPDADSTCSSRAVGTVGSGDRIDMSDQEQDQTAAEVALPYSPPELDHGNAAYGEDVLSSQDEDSLPSSGLCLLRSSSARVADNDSHGGGPGPVKDLPVISEDSLELFVVRSSPTGPHSPTGSDQHLLRPAFESRHVSTETVDVPDSTSGLDSSVRQCSSDNDVELVTAEGHARSNSNAVQDAPRLHSNAGESSCSLSQDPAVSSRTLTASKASVPGRGELLTPNTRMRQRSRLQRAKRSQKRACASSLPMESSEVSKTAADRRPCVKSKHQETAISSSGAPVYDFPADSPDTTDVPQHVESCPSPEYPIVISDASGSDGEIDATASLENMSRRQLQRRVVKLRPRLKAIFSGETYNAGHEKYKEGGKAAKELGQQHSLVSCNQQETVARMLALMFCRDEKMSYYDYTMQVLLPECLVMLVSDINSISEDSAREKLISY